VLPLCPSTENEERFVNATRVFKLNQGPYHRLDDFTIRLTNEKCSRLILARGQGGYGGCDNDGQFSNRATGDQLKLLTQRRFPFTNSNQSGEISALFAREST
jgi:hypothetical protein